MESRKEQGEINAQTRLKPGGRGREGPEPA